MKNKLLTWLLAISIALGLWLYVVTVVSPNSDRKYHNVEVTIQGESLLQERGLMVVTEKLPTVSLQLAGNRTDLDKLNENNITLTVDVSRIEGAGVHPLRFTPSYPGDVPSTAITVLNQDPVAVSIEVEERKSAPVPVEVIYDEEKLAQDFIPDQENMELSVAEIQVAGPKSVVDKIKKAQIKLDLEDGHSESINGTFPYTLCDDEGNPVTSNLLSVNADSVSVMLRIVRIKEVALSFDEILYGGGATKANTEITILPETIKISGSENLTDEVERISLGKLDLSEVMEDTELEIPITLKEDITNETGVQVAKVSIKFKGLETKTVTVSNIQAVNVTQGLSLDLITEVIDITLRGPSEKMKNLTAENVTVIADFGNKPIGTAKVKAEIRVNIDGVGALGTYPVSAELKIAENGARNGTAGQSTNVQ